MLAIKINDLRTEEYLAKMALEQGKSRQAIVREILRKQIEDAEDYQAAVASAQDPSPGIPLSDVMRRYGLEH